MIQGQITYNFVKSIKVADCIVEIRTNSISINNYITANYMICEEKALCRVNIIKCITLNDLFKLVKCNFNLSVDFCDKVTENFECRRIENSFLIRIVKNNEKYILFYNDVQNDIIEFVYSVLEFAVLSFIPEKYLILHSSMVEINGSAILFSGKSGSGKTTMALLTANTGAKFIENEHVIIDLNEHCVLYKTSCDIRVKNNTVNTMGNIIDYNNLCTSDWSNSFRIINIVFLHFGTKKIKKLGLVDSINNILCNAIITKKFKYKETINSLIYFISLKTTNVFEVCIEEDNFESSLQMINKIIGEIKK